MKKIVFILLLLNYSHAQGQKVKFIRQEPAKSDTVLPYSIRKEYSDCVYNEFKNKGDFMSRIDICLFDAGYKTNEEKAAALDILAQNITILDITLKAFRKYCAGNDGNCLYKYLKSIGVTQKSAETITDYIILKFKNDKINYHNY